MGIPIKKILSDEAEIAAADIGSYAVTTAKLDTNAITSAKITAYNVTTVKLDTSAVTANEIGSFAVTNAKMGTTAVTASKMDYTSVRATVDTVVFTVTHSLGATPSIIIFEPLADVAGKDVWTSSKNATTGIFIAKLASWVGNIVFIK